VKHSHVNKHATPHKTVTLKTHTLAVAFWATKTEAGGQIYNLTDIHLLPPHKMPNPKAPSNEIAHPTSTSPHRKTLV
jgi:hypothetical protein